jgi:hypothetical protein
MPAKNGGNSHREEHMTEKRQGDEDTSSASKGVEESRRNFLKATTLAASAVAVESVASPFVSISE